ncbi:MAG: hypothetical protein ABIH70_09100 [Chloroflexota bacterium]
MGIISGEEFAVGYQALEDSSVTIWRKRSTIVALGKTIRIMAEIDELIPRWPIE